MACSRRFPNTSVSCRQLWQSSWPSVLPLLGCLQLRSKSMRKPQPPTATTATTAPTPAATLTTPATPEDAQRVYKIYIPSAAQVENTPRPSPTSTPSPAPNVTQTPRPTATRTSTAVVSPSPTKLPVSSPTPSGPTTTPPPPGTVDLSIDSLEVTQGIQTNQNTIALVAGRTTVLRVYARTSASTNTSNVSLSITALRDGAVVAGSPLVVGPRLVSSAPTRSTYDSSFNVALPADWLSGRVMLSVSLDSTQTVSEVNETNNTATADVTFVGVLPLDVVIVPIRYTHTPNGQVYAAPTVDTISAVIAKLYPISAINLSWHVPVNFNNDLGNSNAWSTLLNQVTSLRQSEAGASSPRLYYALVPIQNASGRWFSSGIAGIGWLGGYRASVGLDLVARAQALLPRTRLGTTWDDRMRHVAAWPEPTPTSRTPMLPSASSG